MMTGKAPHYLRKAGQAVLDALLPPLCPVTKDIVDAPGALSPQAWADLDFIARPVCASCGYPFEYAGLEDQLCGACEIRPPRVQRTRSALVYNTVSRTLVLSLKTGGHTDGVARLAAWMAQAGGDVLQSDSAILPVPLHWVRRLHRRFNQSALLGRALAKRKGLRFCPQWLVRQRATPRQGGLGARARRHNVAGAFRVPQRCHAQVRGAHIVLVDDVRTTGATLDACARPLLAAGAARVDALTLCRVVKPADAAK